MFAAFWVSFMGAVLLSITFAALSNQASDIRVANWLTAAIKMENNSTVIKRHVYAGSILAVFDCEPKDNPDCPSSWEADRYWTVDACKEHGSYCDNCAQAATSTVTLAFFGLLSMVPQMLVDLQRSTEAGDLNCQKWVGLYAAIFGTLSTLVSLLQCYSQCYANLYSGLKNEFGGSISLSLGPAYICLIVATILKPFDLWAHWIVPVPLYHWDPDHPEYFDENHRRTAAEVRKDEQHSLGKVSTLDADLELSKPAPTTEQRTWSGLFDCSTSRIIPVSLIAENNAPSNKIEDVHAMQLTDIVE